MNPTPKSKCTIGLQKRNRSFQYHKLHPNYILSRLSGKDENNNREAIFLLQSTEKDCSSLEKVEEAAEYIENFKLSDNRDPAFKKPVFVPTDERTALNTAAVGILTGARSVTKTDAQRLLFNFGTLKAICEATEEQLALCPGLGPIRARNLYSYLRTPFTT
ncbi:unnamed protein product [Angiostrongylus costaricensis]|uniref:HHH_2 domain-containing protein n=1 Tax=Angiostrongylus costaricensis TaxID=334426 RepID=A0A0R3PGI7_ANGCS|nr:unnamed protein product [Angiostrongylus costaricensis]